MFAVGFDYFVFLKVNLFIGNLNKGWEIYIRIFVSLTTSRGICSKVFHVQNEKH